MAGEQGETQAAVNGTSNGVRSGGGMAAQRAATLAALEAGEATAVEKPAAEAPVVEDEDVEDDTAPDDAAEDTDELDTTTDDADDDQETDEEPDAKAKDPDPDLAKRLSQVQKAERRSKETLAKLRDSALAEVDSKRAELKSDLDELAEYKQAKARAKYNPTAFLKAAGVEDLETAARHVYAHSKAGSADPKNRDAVERTLQAQEQADDVAAVKRELAEFKASAAAREQQETTRQQINGYLESTAKANKDPLITNKLTANPAKTRHALLELAAEIAGPNGAAPTPAVLLAAYGKRLRQEAAELGVDVSKIAPVVAKAEAAKTGTKKPVAVTTARGSTSDKSIRVQREETLRLLEAGKLD